MEIFFFSFMMCMMLKLKTREKSIQEAERKSEEEIHFRVIASSCKLKKTEFKVRSPKLY